MTTPTNATVTTTPEADSEYCDCARSGDLWRCQAPGAVCRPDGKGCALSATIKATGRDHWNPEAEIQVKRTPCPCGRPRR